MVRLVERQVRLDEIGCLFSIIAVSIGRGQISACAIDRSGVPRRRRAAAGGGRRRAAGGGGRGRWAATGGGGGGGGSAVCAAGATS